MSRRSGVVLAWSVWVVTVGCFVAILMVGGNAGDEGTATAQAVAVVVYGVLVLSFATVGAVVASRVPRNAVGWLCCAMALLPALGGLGDEYVLRALGPERLPGAGYIAASQSLWNAFIALPALLLLLFPTGTPPGRRWRGVLMTLLLGIALVLVGDVVKSETDYKGLANPLAIDALQDIVPAVTRLGGVLIAAASLLSFVSLVFRFRRASSEERQQLKLLSYSLILIVIGVGIASVLETSGKSEASNAVISGSLISIPVSIGFAVLKHRLYDIDVIINRTLVYAALTAILGGAYIGLVFGLQALLSPFTSGSDLAVAGSTLAVAALFRPVRKTVQGFIDRRFYRRRFNAQQTLEDFGSTLRDEVDLSSLSRRLESVVRDTMQPAHVSLWLKEAR